MKKGLNNSAFRLIAALAISLFIALPTLAKERQGSMLRIVRNDGTTIKGELFEIRGNSLILVDPHTSEVSLTAIAEVRDLFIKSEPRTAGNAILGLLGGALLGTFVTFCGKRSASFNVLPNFNRSTNGLIGAGVGGLVGLAVGVAVGKSQRSDVKLIENGYFYPSKAAAMKRLNSLARHKMEPAVSWKFTFSGPSDETYFVTFASTANSRNFSFPELSGYGGTYTDDGKNVTFIFTSRPSIQFSGHFIDKNTMIGTWENNGEVWNWTAARASWLTEVKLIPASDSRLFREKLE